MHPVIKINFTVSDPWLIVLSVLLPHVSPNRLLLDLQDNNFNPNFSSPITTIPELLYHRHHTNLHHHFSSLSQTLSPYPLLWNLTSFTITPRAPTSPKSPQSSLPFVLDFTHYTHLHYHSPPLTIPLPPPPRNHAAAPPSVAGCSMQITSRAIMVLYTLDLGLDACAVLLAFCARRWIWWNGEIEGQSYEEMYGINWW